MKTFLKKTAKAWVASAVGALTFLTPVIDDGLTPSEVLGTLLAGIIAWQAVFWTKNAQ